MTGHSAVEVAKTVLEVADVAWTAMERGHHFHHHNNHQHEEGTIEHELDSLKSENHRLGALLEQNLKLLQNISESPSLLKDCPPDVRPYLCLWHPLPFSIF